MEEALAFIKYLIPRGIDREHYLGLLKMGILYPETVLKVKRKFTFREARKTDYYRYTSRSDFT